MRDAKRARKCLAGHWPAAIAVECALLGTRAFLLLLELFLLRWSSLGAERVIRAPDLFQGAVAYIPIVLGSLSLNWLLLSPLKLGRAAFYWQLSHREKPSLSVLTSYYRSQTCTIAQPWQTSLRWQWGLGWRRLICRIFCFAPAALTLGYADVVRHSGSETLSADIKLLICWAAAVVLLCAGFVLQELIMLTYLPSTYLIIEGVPLYAGVFRRSSRLMRRQLNDACSVYLGFAGWFAACLLILPLAYVCPLFQTTRCLAVRRFVYQQVSTTRVIPTPTSISPSILDH